MLLDWFWTLLFKLGLLKKQATVLLLGLDNAGKTTLLHKLKYGRVHLFTPTQRAQVEEIQLGKLKLRAWDLGGHQQVRALWRDYFMEADAVIFVVDSADGARLAEAKAELHALLDEPALDGAVFLVLANKSDLTHALTEQAVGAALDVERLRADKLAGAYNGHLLNVFRCSLVNGTGYTEAFTWLSNTL